MTRYFITLQEAIGLLFEAAEKSVGGEIFVMKMKACKIIDLAQVMIKALGNVLTQIEVVGIRPGEKLDEVLVSESEANHTYSYNSKYYLIAPMLPIENIMKAYKDFSQFQKVTFTKYSSRDELMNEDEIWQMLKDGAFI